MLLTIAEIRVKYVPECFVQSTQLTCRKKQNSVPIVTTADEETIVGNAEQYTFFVNTIDFFERAKLSLGLSMEEGEDGLIESDLRQLINKTVAVTFDQTGKYAVTIQFA